MIMSIVYLLLAAFGLGVLIFIHELGHYFMARHVGMKVEAFGIGFGKPFKTWEHKGVKWNLCWLPFGGYVRIAGMEKQGGLEPHQIPDGFYGRRPIDRIKVALMGPTVNIVFAFLVFVVIWASGGRQKPFSEYTHTIGYLDPSSKFYAQGARPGDQIIAYDHRTFGGFNDLLYSLVFDNNQTVNIRGYKIDYFSGKKTPYDDTIETYQEKNALQNGMTPLGGIRPASYLIYDRLARGKVNPLPDGSPMQDSGIQYKDRILWVDGHLVFSQVQMSAILNDTKALLTVRRGKDTFHTRIPRVKVIDMRINANQREEFEDWQHASQLNIKPDELLFVPYTISADKNIVEYPITYLDENAEITRLKTTSSSMEIPLEAGDQIVAVDGVPVASSLDLLKQLQQKKVQIIVQRGFDNSPTSWKNEDELFYAGVNWSQLDQVVQSIGTSSKIDQIGNLKLLAPVTPRALSDFPLTAVQQEKKNQRITTEKEKIAKVEDAKQQAAMLRHLEKRQKRLMLGIELQDRPVNYNPSPLGLFVETLDQTWRTLKALVVGHLSPKLLQGPIGMVQVMQYGWSVGVNEALFWIAVISMNLGILNLLPLPVLDGGHICFSLWEAITKKPIKTKTMEKMIIPFIVLLVGMLIYITFQDVMRLVGGFF
jgi:regulator of sigma E protease